jgi:hypothetical protein
VSKYMTIISFVGSLADLHISVPQCGNKMGINISPTYCTDVMNVEIISGVVVCCY